MVSSLASGGMLRGRKILNDMSTQGIQLMIVLYAEIIEANRIGVRCIIIAAILALFGRLRLTRKYGGRGDQAAVLPAAVWRIEAAHQLEIPLAEVLATDLPGQAFIQRGGLLNCPGRLNRRFVGPC